MSKAQKLEHHATTTAISASALLEDIAAGLADGKIGADMGDEHVELTPGTDVEVEVRLCSKANSESIRIELSWSKRAAVAPLRLVTDDGEVSMGPDVTPRAEPSQSDTEEPALEQILESLPRARLYTLAQSHDVHGRSTMTKAELVEALAELLERDDLTREDLAATDA